MPTDSRISSTSLPRSSFVPRFQISSGSSTMSRTERRGLSEETGSWKIIWTFVRASRTWLWIERRQILALEGDRARRRAGDLHDRPAGRALAAARLADDAERLAAQHVEADAGHRLDGVAALDLELDDEILDAEDLVALAEVGLARAGHQETAEMSSGMKPVTCNSASFFSNSGEPTGYQQAYTCVGSDACTSGGSST